MAAALAPTVAFIGLGANLGQPAATLASAVHALHQTAGCTVQAVSSLYASAPLGPPGQPPYLNAVAAVLTTLTPHALLAALHAIEAAHGRERLVRWGARTLDLDLLLFGRDCIATADLTVPHAELSARNFVLVPLCELQPALTLPNGIALHTLPAAQHMTGLHIAQAGHAWSGLRF